MRVPPEASGVAFAEDFGGWGATCAWDALNRMVGQYGGGAHDGEYRYRADGMRVSKVIDPTYSTEPPLWTRFRYDGQTGFEDWETQGGYATLYRYGLGARGIDVMDRQAFYPSGPQQSVRVFPVYDAHGNMVATISRDGNGGFSLNDRRTFDAWGQVRSEQHGNDPRLRYCGSLGHKQDDESGLVYMRARYYEPSTGRFVSEDPGRDGRNWFAYCGGDPVNKVDQDGKDTIEQMYMVAFAAAFFTGVGTMLGNAMVGKLDSAAVWKAAIGFYLRFFVGLADVANAKNFDELAEDAFKDKMSAKSWQGGILGTFGGVAAAIKLGDHGGKLALELFYIDNPDMDI